MAEGVSLGADHGRVSLRIYAKKMLGGSCCHHGIDGGIQASVRAVLKSHRHGQAAGHFTVGLGFRCPGTNGHPGEKPCNILGRDRIKDFCGGGKSHLVDFNQQGSGFF